MKVLHVFTLVFGVMLCVPAALGNGFTLLGFPRESDVDAGSYWRWQALQCGTGPQYAPGEPVTITYRVDDDFLDNQDPVTRANAVAEIEAALQTWSEGTRGFLRFVPSPWQPIQNSDDNLRICTEGPGIDEWNNLPNPGQVLPGWGGNLEFFSVPTGFQITSNGQDFEMGAGNLAFAVVYWIGNSIESADIYVNEDFNWTTTPGAAALAPGVGPQPYQCTCGLRHHFNDGSGPYQLPHDRPRPGDAQPNRGASRMPTYDVQTVMLHEIGHALGLDHPNEASQNSGALMDAVMFNYLPGNQWSNTSVMHAAYTGLKRELDWPEYGAMFFLYPPSVPGDVDSDGSVTLLDTIGSLDLVSPDADPTPWDINLLDFGERDGQISIQEISQVMLWATRPEDFPPPTAPAMPGLCDGSPNSVTITADVRPWDIGIGSPVEVDVFITNASALPVQAWDFEMQYDQTILSNPQIVGGELLPDGIWISTGPDDGIIKFSKLSSNEDCSTEGLLGTVRFDVNIPNAVSAGATFVFFPMQQLIVTCPSLHAYGTLGNESYTVIPASAIAWNYDANLDGNISIDDWYAFNLSPIDVDGDGSVTDIDRRAFRDNLRFGEIPSMEANR